MHIYIYIGNYYSTHSVLNIIQHTGGVHNSGEEKLKPTKQPTQPTITSPVASNYSLAIMKAHMVVKASHKTQQSLLIPSKTI